MTVGEPGEASSFESEQLACYGRLAACVKFILFVPILQPVCFHSQKKARELSAIYQNQYPEGSSAFRHPLPSPPTFVYQFE